MWMRRQTSLSECALVVAIPLDHDEYAADAAQPTDFVRRYAASLGRLAPDSWRAYRAYAQRCLAVIDDVGAMGVTVIRRATVSRLAQAMIDFPVVTLVAHGRGPEIAPQDILDLGAAMNSLPAMREALGVSIEIAGNPDRIDLAAWMDVALGPSEHEVEHEPDETRAQARRVTAYRERWRRRQQLEAVCGPALGGGPAIEFHDGLVPVATLASVLPDVFGTLDLTVCDSVLLAEQLRETRASGLILANPRPTTPDFRLALYREAIGLIGRRRMSYTDAVLRLRRSLVRLSS